MNVDELNSALCDMYDVKRALDKNTMDLPKDNDGTEITIGDCIDDVIDFLESCETTVLVLSNIPNKYLPPDIIDFFESRETKERKR